MCGPLHALRGHCDRQFLLVISGGQIDMLQAHSQSRLYEVGDGQTLELGCLSNLLSHTRGNLATHELTRSLAWAPASAGMS